MYTAVMSVSFKEECVGVWLITQLNRAGTTNMLAYVKGKSHDIQKTFKGLAAGKYQIAPDFIKVQNTDLCSSWR